MKKKPDPKRRSKYQLSLTCLYKNLLLQPPLTQSNNLGEGTEQTSDENTVGSWEDLPAGDYIDPDENGTNWFKANSGDHWYQNADGSWTKWLD